MNRPNRVLVTATALLLASGVQVIDAAPRSETNASLMRTIGAAPLPNGVLARHRGGHAVELNIANLHAKLSQNKALDNVSGDNYVGQSAFANANGFDAVIQNSGNNVIIQNSTIVNLKMQ